MLSPDRPSAHSEPNIIGSTGLRLPQQRRRSPKCPVAPARTAAIILAKRNTPFYLYKIKALHIGVRAGRVSGHHSLPPGARAAAAHQPRRAASNATAPPDNSLSGRKIPCSSRCIPCSERNRESPAGSSNRHTISRRPAPKRPEFAKFPVLFPVVRECADQIRPIPDFAALNPGYACSTRLINHAAFDRFDIGAGGSIVISLPSGA
jgi:hypothetical protein